MPDTTPNYAFRIPKADGTDLIVPDDVRVPIASIDSTIRDIDNRVDVFDQIMPITVGTGIFTISTGWQLDSQFGWKWGRFVQITLTFTKITSTIVFPADGNIANVEIGRLSANWCPISRTGLLINGAAGPIWAGYVDPLSSNGVVGIGAGPPNYTLPINGQLSCNGSWLWRNT